MALRNLKTTKDDSWFCSHIQQISPRFEPLNSWRLPSTKKFLLAEGADLLGLSIDSYYSHVAWVRNIKEKFGGKITEPITKIQNHTTSCLVRSSFSHILYSIIFLG